MAGQMPILGFFAVKWLPRAPRQTLYVLALHTIAALAAMAPYSFTKKIDYEGVAEFVLMTASRRLTASTRAITTQANTPRLLHVALRLRF